MPLSMFCIAQKVLECYRRGSLLCIMLCYEITVTFRRIATVEQLQLEQTARHTHTHSALPYPLCGYASRHKKSY